jgi:hypothetical protein
MDALTLRRDLSASVRESIIKVANAVGARSIDADDEFEAKRYNKMSDRLHNIAFKLGQAKFKSAVIGEMREYFYSKDFVVSVH